MIASIDSSPRRTTSRSIVARAPANHETSQRVQGDEVDVTRRNTRDVDVDVDVESIVVIRAAHDGGGCGSEDRRQRAFAPTTLRAGRTFCGAHLVARIARIARIKPACRASELSLGLRSTMRSVFPAMVVLCCALSTARCSLDTCPVRVDEVPIAPSIEEGCSGGTLDVAEALALSAHAPGDVLTSYQSAVIALGAAHPLDAPTSAADASARAQLLRPRLVNEVLRSGAAASWADAARAPAVIVDEIERGDHVVRIAHFEALPGAWLPALWYVPKGDVPVGGWPAVLSLSGHAEATTKVDIQRRNLNLVKRGIVVLQVEWWRMGQLEVPGNGHERLSQLELAGVSSAAPFALGAIAALDVLEQLDDVDVTRIGVVGFSGGGWQALWLAAVDERVAYANVVAGFAPFEERATFFGGMGDAEQAPTDLFRVADYSDLVQLVAPRPLLLTWNSRDQFFPAGTVAPAVEPRARPTWELFDASDALRAVEIDATHVMSGAARRALHEFLNDVLALGADPADLAVDADLLSDDEARRPLPEGNLSLNELALLAASGLQRPALPTAPEDLVAWQARERGALVDILALDDRMLADQQVLVRSEYCTAEGHSVRVLEILVDGFPADAIEIAPGGANETIIAMNDRGRAELVELVTEELAAGRRVVALDPLFIGRSALGDDWLYALLLGAAGKRPLAVEAQQLLALHADVLQRSGARASVVSRGKRTSMVALTAAALAPRALAHVQLNGALTTLQTLIDDDASFLSAVQLFPYRLFTRFDVEHLAMLALPTRTDGIDEVVAPLAAIGCD